MAQALILHVGAPKTGTSYLQRVLWENRDVLAESGIELPLGDRRRQLAASAHLREVPWAKDMWRAGWEDLAAAVDAIEGTAVVSEELLCRTPPERIAMFTGAIDPGTDVHVVYSARDPGRQVPAMWQHAVRARGRMTFARYLTLLRDPEAPYWQEQSPVYALDRWGPFVKPGRFHLLTVPPAGSDPGLLWRRFAGILGVDPARAALPQGLENESLGVTEAELLRRLNARLGDRFPLRRPYVESVRANFIVPALRTAPNAVRIRVPDDVEPWLSDRARGIVEELAGRADELTVVGDLQELVLPVETAGESTPDRVDDSELLAALLDANVRQLDHLEAQRVKRSARMKALRAAAASGSAPLSGPLSARALGRLRRAAGRLKGRR